MRRSIHDYGLLAELVSLLCFRPLVRASDALYGRMYSQVPVVAENQLIDVYEAPRYSYCSVRFALLQLCWSLTMRPKRQVARWLCRCDDRARRLWGFDQRVIAVLNDDIPF